MKILHACCFPSPVQFLVFVSHQSPLFLVFLQYRFEDILSGFNIVNRGDWLGSPENIKGANKNAKIYVGRSTTLHNLLFCAHTLCMNYVTNTFLLPSSSVRSKQLSCFVQGQGQKSKQKHTTKSIDEFHNHSPLLTMVSIILHTLMISSLKSKDILQNLDKM